MPELILTPPPTRYLILSQHSRKLGAYTVVKALLIGVLQGT